MSATERPRPRDVIPTSFDLLPPHERVDALTASLIKRYGDANNDFGLPPEIIEDAVAGMRVTVEEARITRFLPALSEHEVRPLFLAHRKANTVPASGQEPHLDKSSERVQKQ